jgi:hypothetical protein
MRRVELLVAAGALVALAGACKRDLATATADGGDARAPPEPMRGNVSASEAWVTHRWTFALGEVALTIEDARMSTRLDEVLERASAELVVNAGFFDPEGKPVGLSVSGGRVLSPPSRTMSGGVLSVEGGVGSLAPTEGFELPSPIPDFAVQCRPRLVVDRIVNIRSDDGVRAERTALCLRDAGSTLDVVLSRPALGAPAPTLFELATSLAAFGCDQALNLDGGPSTGAAVRGSSGVELVAPRAGVRQAVAVRRVTRSVPPKPPDTTAPTRSATPPARTPP